MGSGQKPGQNRLQFLCDGRRVDGLGPGSLVRKGRKKSASEASRTGSGGGAPAILVPATLVHATLVPARLASLVNFFTLFSTREAGPSPAGWRSSNAYLSSRRFFDVDSDHALSFPHRLTRVFQWNFSDVEPVYLKPNKHERANKWCLRVVKLKANT